MRPTSTSRRSNDVIRFLAVLLALVVTLGFPAPSARAADPAEVVAMRLLDLMDAKDYSAAEASFTQDMAAAVPADKLKAVWESLPAQFGLARGRGEAKLTPHQDMQVVVVPLHYANGELIAQVVVDAGGRIAGFLVQPAPPAPAAAPAADASYIERDFPVGELRGTLAMPKTRAAQKIAAVVLVHGSGPQDRDQTVGPNRPFLDIARGLAAQGIAVQRYEKRTKARPQDFADGKYTMDEETTNDAVAAAAALRTAPGIDSARSCAWPQPGRHARATHCATIRPCRRPDPVRGTRTLPADHPARAEPLPAQRRWEHRCSGAGVPRRTGAEDRQCPR